MITPHYLARKKQSHDVTLAEKVNGTALCQTSKRLQCTVKSQTQLTIQRQSSIKAIPKKTPIFLEFHKILGFDDDLDSLFFGGFPTLDINFQLVTVEFSKNTCKSNKKPENVVGSLGYPEDPKVPHDTLKTTVLHKAHSS